MDGRAEPIELTITMIWTTTITRTFRCGRVELATAEYRGYSLGKCITTTHGKRHKPTTMYYVEATMNTPHELIPQFKREEDLITAIDKHLNSRHVAVAA